MGAYNTLFTPLVSLHVSSAVTLALHIKKYWAEMVAQGREGVRRYMDEHRWRHKGINTATKVENAEGTKGIRWANISHAHVLGLNKQTLMQSSSSSDP